jgi:hypothetical protein
MKKISLIMVGILGFAMGNAYLLHEGENMYNGPEVKEERSEGSAYVPPNRDFINSEYGEKIDPRQTEFRPNQDSEELFWANK